MSGPNARHAGERGSVIVGVVLVGVATALAVALVAGAQVVGMRAHAVTAADAAALAAAPVTFRPFGAEGSPAAEARRFADLHGAQLIACSCAADAGYGTRTVSATVEVRAEVFGFGVHAIRVTSHAEFDPVAVLVDR